MLEFTFRDNDKIIYSNKCNFKKDNNKIEFFCNEETYIFDGDDKKFVFKKINSDNLFTIEKNSKTKNAYIFLKEKNIKFDIKIIFLNYCYKDNYICINYKLESDYESIKTLEIRY